MFTIHGKPTSGNPNRLRWAISGAEGSLGLPDPIYLQKGKTITGEVKKTIEQVLTQSGFSVVENGSPSLEVYFNCFWCDGFMAAKVEGTVEIRLIASGKSTVLYKKEVDEITRLSTYHWDIYEVDYTFSTNERYRKGYRGSCQIRGIPGRLQKSRENLIKRN